VKLKDLSFLSCVVNLSISVVILTLLYEWLFYYHVFLPSAILHKSRELKQEGIVIIVVIITFCVSRRRRKMYCGQACLSVCVSVRGRTPTLLHGPGCNFWVW